MSFVGDARYPRDGGAALQAAWDAGTWRPIRGCDGRYVGHGGDVPAPVRLRARTTDVDGIVVGRFKGGVGVLKYEKADRWVCTLNTESGLVRKLLALDLLDAFSQYLESYALWTSRATAFVLSCLGDRERTRLGPAATAAIRICLARVEISVTTRR